MMKKKLLKLRKSRKMVYKFQNKFLKFLQIFHTLSKPLSPFPGVPISMLFVNHEVLLIRNNSSYLKTLYLNNEIQTHKNENNSQFTNDKNVFSRLLIK